MGERVIMYLETARGTYPTLAERFETFEDLYRRKLWHQLTLKIEESLEEDDFQRGDLLIPFYKQFIATFAHKINLLKLARFAKDVASHFGEPDEAVAFLREVIVTIEESKQLGSMDQPVLYLKMLIAEYQLQMGSLLDCKEAVEQGKQLLNILSDVDPSVSAQVHYVSAMYYKHMQDFAEFYKSSLLYLAYISSDELPREVKLALAVDISLAALLGDNIYNFGELLLHPIIHVLDDSPYRWLHEMLDCFNHGDMHRYDELCSSYAAVLNAQPAMVENERKLREKITILCLMESIFNLPAEERKISLDFIAKQTKLSLDGVEFLLMKTLSLHLIEGVIDQVDNTVQVSWVQPRVLTLPQVSGLKGRLENWISKVNAAALTLEQESADVV